VDTATLIGLVLGFVLVAIGISITPGGSLGLFLDAPSAFITIGGAICATMVNFSFRDLRNLPRLLRLAFKVPEGSPLRLIGEFRRYADIARRDGILALEGVVQEVKDPFLVRGIQLAVDGTDPEAIQSLLRIDLENTVARHERGIRVLKQFGTYAPAFGMLGTLIGLVIMLTRIKNPDMIAPAMAVAIITTFYGVILSYLVAQPLAEKLILRSNEESLIKEMMIRGIMSIQSGDNPRIVEEKLRIYLPPRAGEAGARP
jgi:chemotaxis protein MotA